MNRKFIPILISLLFILSACGLLPQGASLPSTGGQTSQPGPVATDTPSGNPLPSVNPPVTPEPTQGPVNPQPAPTTSPAEPPAVVNADGLRLRIGPGTGYSPIRLLPQGLELKLIGRSQDGDWIVVELPDGAQGWVYAQYIDTSIQIASLPIKEAYGGPDSPAPTGTPKTYSLYMTIREDQAEITIGNFPADTSIVARLGLPGKAASLVLARGKTDASGAALLSFPMPQAWDNGQAIIQEDLVLVVSAEDGSFSRSASIQYIRYQ